MKTTAVLAGLGALAMAIALVYGFAGGDFVSDGRQLLSMTWGRVSLVDLYVGVVLFSSWILFCGGITPGSALWIAAVLTLGSFAICLYVIVALRRSKRDWSAFLLGRHAKEAS